jgi:alpha-beta hydrolase superfamily lysophospholipase
MRWLAQRLHGMGYWAVAIRLPGHGTAPSGLLDFTWQDLAAATRVGARYLRTRIGADQPLYLAGYSMGAALAVEYELARMQGEALPASAGLILFSPAIVVSPAAAFAVWQGRLAAVPGLENAALTTITPEYDPYKYTLHRQRRTGLHAHEGDPGAAGRARFRSGQRNAPDRGIQSAVDDTVQRRRLSIRCSQTRAGGSKAGCSTLIAMPGRPAAVPRHVAVRELKAPLQPFDLTVVTNESPTAWQ